MHGIFQVKNYSIFLDSVYKGCHTMFLLLCLIDFYSVWQSLSPSVLLQVTFFYSFLWLIFHFKHMIQINLFTKQTRRLREWTYDCWGESWGERIFREFGMGWKKQKLESRLPGEISITLDRQMTPPYGRKWRRTKEPIDENERGEWKCWLKTQHSEN